jgi:siroheme synthase
MRLVTVTVMHSATQVILNTQFPGKEVVVRKSGKPVVHMRTVEEKEFALAPRIKQEASHGKR